MEEKKKTFSVHIRLVLTATYEFDAVNAEEAKRQAMLGLDGGHISWDDDYETEYTVKELTDEANPSAS